MLTAVVPKIKVRLRTTGFTLNNCPARLNCEVRQTYGMQSERHQQQIFRGNSRFTQKTPEFDRSTFEVTDPGNRQCMAYLTLDREPHDPRSSIK